MSKWELTQYQNGTVTTQTIESCNKKVYNFPDALFMLSVVVDSHFRQTDGGLEALRQ